MSQQQSVAAAPRRRATQVGTVASLAGSKSVVVRVDSRAPHGRYGKFVNRRSKFMAHDERSECALGDVVEIVATRPLSATKRWRVSRIVRKATVLATDVEE